VASRAELTRVGLEVLGADSTVAPGAYEERMVRAMAAMLATATTSKRARGTKDESKLAVPPRDLFEIIRAGAGDRVLCTPVDSRWFGRLGGALKALPDFNAADPQLLVDWLQAGGCASWPRGVPSFGDLINLLPKWVAWAREWDRRGRQTLRGATAVGAAVNEGGDHGLGGFAVPKLS
jgi:hypothetical protein